ncbi:DNA gyrase inhibitor YacG [Legionella sp. km772]|uniref:DNA gyrase inhibitor YacG n=1 Tax=Legionella sp. km772 TaxID=2498111 RepID=UPI000F8F4288|nr:DNA gyrase inhibitor YacG [Legionella sp. km772]RUR06322.1 DNA gyrase inhibitor YacG [Legionella sp. km772]
MTNQNLNLITCPTCGKKNTWRLDNSFRPFCSDRCKMIDLGEWASETRKIPSDPIDFTRESIDKNERDE